ncbi:MAG: DNA repair protein RecN [Chloroflexota bacterium]|jgi:DNA repair protein RecN (Recombination protein N)
MLSELYIRDFAIIDELRLEFASGLNVLTGETGAGKSIILDAMTLVLGERADMTMIRTGKDIAYVEAAFRLSNRIRNYIDPVLEEQGLEEEEGILLLARELRTNGRNICRINGRTVNLSLLREIGEMLVDIHGQGEHLSLLKPRSHLGLLDAYAGLEAERKAMRAMVKELRAVQREQQSLRRDERELAQRMDLLKYQIEEIDTARLESGEEEVLRAERKRAANLEQILNHCSHLLNILSNEDEDGRSLQDLLGEGERTLAQLAALDETLAPQLERLEGISYQVNDLTAEFLDYQASLDFNANELNQIEERIELITRLKRKYGNDISAILAWRERADEELQGITNSEARLTELEEKERQLLQQAGQQAGRLSQLRMQEATRLSEAMERELADLSMERAQFSIDRRLMEDPDGVYYEGRRLACDETGIDRIEFLVSANIGEEPRPLAKVASGGETSRLMLALKTVLARVDETPTLIFDEIDQGIGGRVGDVVGRKLWGLTSPTGHQVIVVTHLPQLAGYADGHFNVSKHTEDGRTTTEVKLLDEPGRVNELAAMLGTDGEHATGGAQAILKHSADVKSAAINPVGAKSATDSAAQPAS